MAKAKNPIKGNKIPDHIFTKRTTKKLGGDNYTHNIRGKRKIKVKKPKIIG